MTKAQITAAQRIQAKFAAGWRFSIVELGPDDKPLLGPDGKVIPWPPGFQSQIGPVEKRGGHMSTAAGRRWHGDNIAKMGAQR